MSIGPTATDTTFEYDLGVLFVHGIGNQPRGSTLVDFGTPLFEWIADRAEQLGGSAGVDRAYLTPLSEEPASAELTIASDGHTRHWLVAEAWWAESYAIRPFPEVARWMLGVVPWTFGSHFGRRLARALRSRPTAGRRISASSDGAEPNAAATSGGAATSEGPSRSTRLIESVRWGARVASAFFALLVGLVISAVMLLLVSALLVLGLIPWDRIRGAIRRLQVRLAATIGDSFVLVGRPVESAAILSRFRRDLGWLSQRCRRVAVIAHSQGAAVAALGLASAPSDRVKFLLTFGSGLRKLEELSQLRRRGTFRRGAALTVAGLVIVMFMLAMIPGMMDLRRELGADAVGFGILALYAAVGLALLIPGIRDFTVLPEPTHIEELLRVFAGGGMVWDDLFASADMIPNGPLLESTVTLPRSTEVVNRASMFADHTSYWENRDEFVTLVAERLLEYDEPRILPGLGPAAVEFLRERRRNRVRSLRVIGWVGAVSVIGVLIRYPADWAFVLQWLARFVADRLAALFGAHVSLGTAPGGEVLARTVGWLAAVLLATLIARAAWSALDRRTTEKPPPYLYQGELEYPVMLGLLLQLVLIAGVWTGNLSGWFFAAALAVTVAVAKAQSAPDAPAELRRPGESPAEQGEGAAAEPQSSADKTARIILTRVLPLLTAAIGVPLMALDLVRWMHARLVQSFGSRYGSWILAITVAAVAYLAASTALVFLVQGFARIVDRRRRVRARAQPVV